MGEVKPTHHVPFTLTPHPVRAELVEASRMWPLRQAGMLGPFDKLRMLGPFDKLRVNGWWKFGLTTTFRST